MMDADRMKDILLACVVGVAIAAWLFVWWAA
jgi:hypothetical protein